MVYHFSDKRKSNKDVVTVNVNELLLSKCFKYLGSILQSDGDIDQDKTLMIKDLFSFFSKNSSLILIRIPLHHTDQMTISFYLCFLIFKYLYFFMKIRYSESQHY